MKAMLSRTEKIHPQTSHKIRADKRIERMGKNNPKLLLFDYEHRLYFGRNISGFLFDCYD